MSVFIYKNDKQYGPYSIDQVKGWLSSGQVQPTDLACYEGATTWVPLSTLLGAGNYLSATQPSGYVTSRPSSGWGLIITGAILTLIGIPLFVFIIGIPLVIAGIPMLIYGRIQFQRRVMWDLKESVRMGVVQGMPPQGSLPSQQYAQQSRLPGPSRPMANFCSNCAAILDADAKFCPSCGTAS
jgi:hypothetical protein